MELFSELDSVNNYVCFSDIFVVTSENLSKQIWNNVIDLLHKTHNDSDNDNNISDIQKCVSDFMSNTESTLFCMDDAYFSFVRHG